MEQVKNSTARTRSMSVVSICLDGVDNILYPDAMMAAAVCAAYSVPGDKEKMLKEFLEGKSKTINVPTWMLGKGVHSPMKLCIQAGNATNTKWHVVDPEAKLEKGQRWTLERGGWKDVNDEFNLAEFHKAFSAIAAMIDKKGSITDKTVDKILNEVDGDDEEKKTAMDERDVNRDLYFKLGDVEVNESIERVSKRGIKYFKCFCFDIVRAMWNLLITLADVKGQPSDDWDILSTILRARDIPEDKIDQILDIAYPVVEVEEATAEEGGQDQNGSSNKGKNGNGQKTAGGAGKHSQDRGKKKPNPSQNQRQGQHKPGPNPSQNQNQGRGQDKPKPKSRETEPDVATKDPEEEEFVLNEPVKEKMILPSRVVEILKENGKTVPVEIAGLAVNDDEAMPLSEMNKLMVAAGLPEIEPKKK